MNIVAIIQARMSSSRLPGKVLLKMDNKTMLEHVRAKVSQVKQINLIVLATSTDPTDDGIFDLCQQKGFVCFRGSLTDVLNRYYEAGKKYKADVVIRITCDNPLIDPQLIDEGITIFKRGNYDYVANKVEPANVIGFEYEIINFSSLEKAFFEAKTSKEREHVTPYIWRTHPEYFKLRKLPYTKNKNQYRLTVDTKEDFELVKILVEKYHADILSFKKIITILDTHPELAAINRCIQQKPYTA